MLEDDVVLIGGYEEASSFGVGAVDELEVEESAVRPVPNAMVIGHFE